MAKRKNTTRVNIPMCAAAVLLCLTLFSTHFTSGLYAKYTATATGSDSARVAKFQVDYRGDSNAIVITTDGSGNVNTYTFTIANNSEVAVSYTLTVTPEIPGVTATFDLNSGNLAVGASADRTLTFVVTDWATFAADSNGDTNDATDILTKEFDFTINVHVEQID